MPGMEYTLMGNIKKLKNENLKRRIAQEYF